MRAFVAFTKKELQESVANYRLLIVLGLFAVLGLLNVFTAKFTPQLISSLVSEELAKSFPEPTTIDVWLQFLKNTSQLGLVVIVIIFSGLLTHEYQKETLTILLTKGLSRWKVIAGKLAASCLLFSTGYWLSVGVTYLYAWFYFEQAGVANMWFAITMLWLFGLFLIVISLLGGILFRNNYSVLLFTVSSFVVMLVVNFFPKMQEYNPLMLCMSNTALLEGTIKVADFYPPLLVMAIFSGGMLVLGVGHFNKKAL